MYWLKQPIKETHEKQPGATAVMYWLKQPIKGTHEK